MIRHTLRWALIGVLVVNITLVLNTLFLSKLSERRYPPAGQFLTVDGIGVHLRDSNPSGASGTPIVLVHGASTSLLDMQAALLPELGRDRRVILVDRPGHGYSDTLPDGWADPARQAGLIADALQILGVERAIWVGHSWGGSVVLAAMLDRPDDVAAGVLLAGASHPWEGGSTWHAEWAARPVLGLPFAWQFAQPGGRLSLEAAIGSVFAPEPIPPDYIEATGVTLSLRPSTFRNNALDLTRLSAFLSSQIRRYPQIDQPLLLLTAGKDTIVPAWNHSERLMMQIDQAERHDYPGAGHGLHHTRAPDIARRIQALSSALETTGTD